MLGPAAALCARVPDAVSMAEVAHGLASSSLPSVFGSLRCETLSMGASPGVWHQCHRAFRLAPERGPRQRIEILFDIDDGLYAAMSPPVASLRSAANCPAIPPQKPIVSLVELIAGAATTAFGFRARSGRCCCNGCASIRAVTFASRQK